MTCNTLHGHEPPSDLGWWWWRGQMDIAGFPPHFIVGKKPGPNVFEQLRELEKASTESASK